MELISFFNESISLLLATLAVVAAATAVAAASVVAFADDQLSTHFHFFFPNCNLENRFVSLLIMSAVFNLS
jgi:hypothetical protein